MLNNYIPYTKIINELPIAENDILLIGSDISRLALMTLKQENHFSPEKFIDSIQQKIFSGTLLFPAFTGNLKSGDIFDIKTTRPITGTLSDTAFKRKDFIRTSDPFHSFLVWGKHQKELKEINNKSTFGKDSVFAFLFNNKAKMLLIDIDMQHSFTFAHFVEEYEQVKFRHYKKYFINYMQEDCFMSNKEFLFYEKKAGISNNFYNLEKKFEEEKISQTKIINSIPFKLIKLEKAFNCIQSDIKKNKGKTIYSFHWKDFFKQKIKTFIFK